MKKALSVFLSLLLCCSFLTVAFAGDDDFEIEDGVLIRYNADDDKVVVPGGVTKLGEYCFDNKKMTELVLPDSLEVIDDFALCWCENLKTVTIPKNVRQLGCYVFEGCMALTAINVAEGNRYFKSVDGVLFDKSGEKLIRFPSAKPAASYRIPDAVKTIDDGAFFQSGLTEVIIGDGVETVGSGSFTKSHDLVGITFGKNVKLIGGYVFCACEKLQSVTLPASLEDLGEFVFDYCTGLQTINVEEGNKYFASQDGVLYTKNKNALIKFPEGRSAEGFTLPDTVKTLITGAFTRCDFTSIDLSGVTEIRDFALNECEDLRSVTLGIGLTSVGRGAFIYDTALRDVYYEGSSADWQQIGIGELNDPLNDAQKHFAGGFVFPEAREREVDVLDEGEEIPELDTSAFSFRFGRDGGNMTGMWRYAFGQAFAFDCYFTLITGPRSGEFLINFRTDGTDDAYRFTVEPYSAYRLTYTYGYSSAGYGYTDRETVEWFCENGSSGTEQVSVTGGTLSRGGLSDVTLLRKDDPPPHEHDWGKPTYVWSEDNAAVTATRVCRGDESHVETETVKAVSAVTPAACTEEGKTTYTATFENPAFAAQTKEVVIPATGHDWGEPTYAWSADNATVTATRVCQSDDSHVETETVNTTSAVTAPTCTEEGKTTYTATFENPAFAAQTKEVAIPAAGHDWGEPTYAWSADNATVTATRTCKTDKTHVETETMNTKTAVTAATCTADGKTTYTATFENPAFAAQTKDVAIPATGHDWGEPAYTWSEDNSTVTAARTCKTDPTHTETETVNTTAAAGADKTTYTAVFENPAFAVQTKDVPLQTERQTGDVDGDGSVTSADARLALRASVHLTNEPGDVKEGTDGYQAADYDKNGRVESADARCILRVSVKLDPFG